ncbi:sulfotransferase family 2 domain-containing protein [Marinibacterium profundimaris]|uniref:sulfotransferase family 2 domain-containing protein n=1 Tax=Marinibacterium profundimaris TaxID=1679460 RepID=UPI00130316F6|nr:sulfotransferase family 2 domain-containing protein [Marinibacterium profundimaris]
MDRTVVLHYHLFKNAGTSLDQILRRNFGPRWVTREFPMSEDNSAELAEWIRSEPGAVAFSTHTAMGPVPRIEGVNIVSVMLLRDPVARIRSAYRFERKQDADTWGAELAKQHDLEGYVRARLERVNDRQCRNFQTHRLASMVPGDAPELDRARAGLRQLSVVGLVEAFEDAVSDLAGAIRPAYPDFEWKTVRANTTTAAPPTSEDARIDTLMAEANADDRALLAEARALLDGAREPE